MRLEAVHDDQGVILAAIAFDDDDTPRPHPVAGEGQTSGTFEVPDELAEVPLEVLCTRLTVDVRAGTLIDRTSTETV